MIKSKEPFKDSLTEVIIQAITLRNAVFVLFLFGIFKLVISSFWYLPNEGDDYQYISMAKSFFLYHNFYFNFHPVDTGGFLYSLVISPAFWISNNLHITYLSIRIINILLSIITFFPAYFIAKRFTSERKAVVTGILITLLPMDMTVFHSTHSENLFVPLLLLTVYLLVRFYFDKELKYGLIGGISLGLLYYTRPFAIVLYPIIILWTVVFLWWSTRFSKPLIQTIKSFFYLNAPIYTGILIILPWLYRNTAHFGSNDALGYQQTITIHVNRVGSIFTLDGNRIRFFLQVLWSHIGIFFFASLIFLPAAVLFLLKSRDKDRKSIELRQFVLFSIFLSAGFIFPAILQDMHRIGLVKQRYMEPVTCLFYISGFATLPFIFNFIRKIRLNKGVIYTLSEKKNLIAIIALSFILSGIIFNIWTLETLFSEDGVIRDSRHRAIIWTFNVLLIFIGLSIFIKRRSLKFTSGALIALLFFIFIGSVFAGEQLKFSGDLLKSWEDIDNPLMNVIVIISIAGIYGSLIIFLVKANIPRKIPGIIGLLSIIVLLMMLKILSNIIIYYFLILCFVISFILIAVLVLRHNLSKSTALLLLSLILFLFIIACKVGNLGLHEDNLEIFYKFSIVSVIFFSFLKAVLMRKIRLVVFLTIVTCLIPTAIDYIKWADYGRAPVRYIHAQQITFPVIKEWLNNNLNYNDRFYVLPEDARDPWGDNPPYVLMRAKYLSYLKYWIKPCIIVSSVDEMDQPGYFISNNHFNFPVMCSEYSQRWGTVKVYKLE